MGSERTKLYWLSFSPARMMPIHSKMKALECSQHFCHYMSMEILPDVQGQPGPTPIQAFIAALATCKIEEDPIKKMEELECSRDFPIISL